MTPNSKEDSTPESIDIINELKRVIPNLYCKWDKLDPLKKIDDSQPCYSYEIEPYGVWISFEKMKSHHVRALVARNFTEFSIRLIECLPILEFYSILMNKNPDLSFLVMIFYNSVIKKYEISLILEKSSLAVHIEQDKQTYNIKFGQCDSIGIFTVLNDSATSLTKLDNSDFYASLLNFFNKYIDKYLDHTSISSREHDKIAEILSIIKY